MPRTPVLREARIQSNVVRYQLTSLSLTLAATIIGIVVLPIVLPIVAWAMTKYYQRLKVVLTRRDLKVHRGVFQREEKSIPLEKVTDLAVFQGPVMRWFDIKGIKVETAGQSSGGALVSVIGIEDVDGFRDAVLDQRDRVSERDDAEPAATARVDPAGDARTLAVLEQIRDSLARVEKRIAAGDSD